MFNTIQRASILIALIFLVFNAYGQTEKITGSWLMIKAEIEGEVQTPYFVTEFNEDGKMIIMGMEAGTWTYNKASHTVEMKSDLDKDFNGTGKIIALTENELQILKDGANLFYRKIDLTNISTGNKDSGLMGTWEFKDVPYPEVNTLVTFKEPDEFSIILREEGMTSNLSGTWIFDKKEMSLLMIGLRGEDTFNGENKVIKITDDTIELENNRKTYKAKLKAENTQEIEQLSFTESDFFNEAGVYKYESDLEKLPWLNWDEMKADLLHVEQLIYNYSQLINGTDVFDSRILTANVHASLEEEGFEIDNIFNGYDRYDLPKDAEWPENPNFYVPLYPLNESLFRITGNEQITTPAGTFDCLVLEAVNESRFLNKLWMIKDRIGVFAKIIDVDPDETFGHYSVYELQEIKRK